jgi:sugar/nucleoside kinase (ribokinase family)
MIDQKERLKRFDTTILSSIGSQPINKKHALLISTTDFSTEESQQTSRKAIIAAHIQHKTVILELEPEQKSACAKALESILPLCHVISGSPEAFQNTTSIKNTTKALQQIRDKSSAILILKRDEKKHEIFEQKIAGKLT